jgi:hypothetical protein
MAVIHLPQAAPMSEKTGMDVAKMIWAAWICL